MSRVSVSILPVAVKDGRAVALLAAPSMMGVFAQRTPNSSLSDWGGYLRSNEGMVEGCLREFQEESGGLIEFDRPIEEVRRCMEQLTYPVISCVNMFRPCSGHHRCYVVHVPFQERCVPRFAFHWNALMQLLPAHTRWKRACAMAAMLPLPTAQRELHEATRLWHRALDDAPEATKSHPVLRSGFSPEFMEKGGVVEVPFPTSVDQIKPQIDGERVRAALNTVLRTVVTFLN